MKSTFWQRMGLTTFLKNQTDTKYKWILLKNLFDYFLDRYQNPNGFYFFMGKSNQMNTYIIILALVLLVSSVTVYGKCYVSSEPFYPVTGHTVYYPNEDYNYNYNYDIQITDTTENVGFGTSRVRQIRRLPSYNPYYWGPTDWQTAQNTAKVSLEDLLAQINPNLVIGGVFLIIALLVLRGKRVDAEE